MWASMSAEDKRPYQLRAAEERERVAKDLEDWYAAGGVATAEANTGVDQHPPGSLTYPVARIRKICKLDPEVRGLSKEAVLLVTKAAELMTSKLGIETVRVAQIQNRRKLLPEDVAQVCSSREQFLFLRDDIKDLMRDQLKKDAEASKKAKESSEASKPSDPDNNGMTSIGSKPLTAYFAPKT